MFLTRWKNLGSGLDDELWKAHSQPSVSLPPATLHLQMGSPGALSELFENGCKVESDPFLSREDKAELFRVQNKKMSASERLPHEII